MKIYNSSPGRVRSYWNAEDKVDTDGKPVQPLTLYVMDGQKQTPDLPPTLADYLLKNFKRRFTADRKAIEQELATKRKLEELGQKNADLENHLLKIKTLMGAAGDTKNKKSAQAAAEELDALLAQGPRSQQGAQETTPAAPAPEPTTVVSNVVDTPPAKDDFESKS